ncbi:DUF1992 domain-containing protein [Vibrio sp. AK197]
MSLLFEQLAEQRILAAMKEGQLDNLPGHGQPLILDDDSMVPEHLRMGYRILKNAGFIPPELVYRQQALELCDLIAECDPLSDEQQQALAKIRQLEFKMKIKGIDTRFLHHYLRRNTSP